IGLKLIIGYMFLNSLTLVASRNFFGAAISLILGIGLLKPKNWAREGSIFFIVIGLIVFSLKTLAEMADNRLHNSDWLAFLFTISLLGLMFSYLRSPEMKELFFAESSNESSGIAERMQSKA